MVGSGLVRGSPKPPGGPLVKVLKAHGASEGSLTFTINPKH